MSNGSAKSDDGQQAVAQVHPVHRSFIQKVAMKLKATGRKKVQEVSQMLRSYSIRRVALLPVVVGVLGVAIGVGVAPVGNYIAGQTQESGVVLAASNPAADIT